MYFIVERMHILLPSMNQSNN